MDRIVRLYTIPKFSRAMSKLYDGSINSIDEVEYLLGCALLLLREYDKTNERVLFELAYNIVLRYSVGSGDYKPLYDLSCNYGFYPTIKFINQRKLLNRLSLQDAFLGYQVERFNNEGYIETYEQNKTRKSIINSDKKNIAFIAPTSSGKSSLIIQHLEKHKNIEKAVIIVPTKSLISQTYMELRKNIHNRKIISHEGMYNAEKQFVGALTQERLLRLLENNQSMKIDCIYVDEAHNIFKNDARNILLARALKICKKRNPSLQIIFLSPFVNDAQNLMIGEINEIDEQRISFNIKEPNIFVKEKDGAIQIYDRFSDNFHDMGKCDDAFRYIKERQGYKNFIFLNTPKKIEDFAEDLFNNTDEIHIDEEILELQNLLSKVVHPKFNIIRYLSHGIIYLHANIPNQIKEYLEYQFKTNNYIKYLIANVVIMEGINLPIDCLFVCNAWRMNGSALQNLVGRVNRLNHVFDKNNEDLKKLVPEIHFLDIPRYTAKNLKMENVVRKIYNIGKDEVRNPLLENCSLEDLKIQSRETEKKKNEQILEQEKVYFSIPTEELEVFRKKLITAGMNQLVDVTPPNVKIIKANLSRCNFEQDIIDIVSEVFTKNVNVTDAAFRRLANPSAIRFYKFFMKELKKGDLASLITSQLEYQKNRVEKDHEPYMYVGTSYGEVKGWYDEIERGHKVYIDVRTKTSEQLINLLIVKTKIEQEFLGFQYNRAVNFLHDNEYISDEQYNLEIYGTNDDKKIQLLNLGISMSLLNVLDDSNQISNISFDTYGNMIGNEKLREFRDSQNSFLRYEINKYIYFE